ncbi:mushroom body large-type Kenyon cell-specific protein 1 isoform X2 [Neocloeon triangulifer]|uniref:mushroom body large-type Kenyon cell-specific protein 1 isoform X2 n=1 Tax=Neocloeon triangulifer TaxID=2078957 RepID=UPI00286EFC69|nr:mushroom body large-type Kenyon cell-specific protein 1 isoform X2 [Neocloeon triangulifer]
MAECSYSSCIQEKRAIKRELQKWTKDLVYLVGLERVAEELMGRRKWRQYQAHILGASAISKHETQTAWEKRSKEEIVKEEEVEAAAEAAVEAAAPEAAQDPPKDWQPEDRCYFCDGAVHTEPCRSPQPSESSQSSMDSSPQPASVDLNAAIGAHPGNQAFSPESLNRMASTLAAMASMAGNPAAVVAAAAAAGGAAPGLNPLFAAPGFFPWYLSQALAKQQQHQQQQQQQQQLSPAATPTNMSSGGEQPLDLSAKPSSKAGPSDGRLDSPTLLKRSGIDVNSSIIRSTVAGRRTYTEEELQAALRDIQSGKLGTRRAAVIYGIPRSTLRNKVYKLERERERDHLLLQSTPPPPAPAPPGADDNSGDEDGSKTLSMEELVRFSGLDSLPATDSLRQLLQSSARDGAASKPPAAPASFPEPPAALAPYLSQLLGAASAEQQSGLVELMKRIGGGGAASENNNNASGSGADATSEDEGAPSSVLRIPSFKPNGNEAPEQRGSGSNSPSLGVSLRDVITKSITQKFQSTPSISVVDPATLMANPMKRMSESGGDRFLPHHQKPHHSQHQQHHHHQQQSQDSKNNKGGKGTRPKRGKYRNYDRDSLIEAVRAVQRGEMSVHRAGSYYGVPHSTLEYKVKERHLMRPRKRDLNKAAAASTGGLVDDKPKIGPPRGPMPKPPPGAPGSPFPNLAAMAGLANGLGGKGLFGPGPPPLAASAGPYHQFWPGAANPFMINPELYQEQLLASHMMQQRKADPVADRFFDGLIRNSLERPSASGEAAGLANRALLEQLCRGRPAASAAAGEQTVVDLSQEDERPTVDSEDEAAMEAEECDKPAADEAEDEQGTSSSARRNSTD